MLTVLKFQDFKNRLETLKDKKITGQNISMILACGKESPTEDDIRALHNEVNKHIQQGFAIYSELAPVCRDLVVAVDGSERSEHAKQLNSKFETCKRNHDFKDYCNKQSLVLSYYRNDDIKWPPNNTIETLRQSLGENTEHNKSFGKDLIRINKTWQTEQNAKEAQKKSRQKTYRKRLNTAPAGDIANSTLLLEGPSTDPWTSSNGVLQIEGTPTSRKQKPASNRVLQIEGTPTSRKQKSTSTAN